MEDRAVAQGGVYHVVRVSLLLGVGIALLLFLGVMALALPRARDGEPLVTPATYPAPTKWLGGL